MFLMMDLIEPGYSFTANAEKEFVPVVKEKLCYICLDFGTEHKSLAQADKENVYVLPEGNIITVATNVSVARNCCSQHSAHGRLDVDFQRLAPRIILTGSLLSRSHSSLVSYTAKLKSLNVLRYVKFRTPSAQRKSCSYMLCCDFGVTCDCSQGPKTSGHFSSVSARLATACAATEVSRPD